MGNSILIDFMMYSYFGVVPRELYDKSDSYEDDCVRKAIMKAYVDATNQGAYNTLFTKQAKEKNPKIKEYSENAKKSGAQKIFKEICSLSCNDETSFTQWHQKLCDMLVSEYSQVYVEDKPFFTYGNAQKWVNMSLKYIFITQSYCGKCGQNVNSVKNFLHIPLDSYIISALKNEGVEIKEKWSQIAEYGKIDDRSKASYMAYVNDIKEIAQAPIEWENIAWIEQAEKAKKKDKDKQYQSFWG